MTVNRVVNVTRSQAVAMIAVRTVLPDSRLSNCRLIANVAK